MLITSVLSSFYSCRKTRPPVRSRTERKTPEIPSTPRRALHRTKLSTPKNIDHEDSISSTTSSAKNIDENASDTSSPETKNIKSSGWKGGNTKLSALARKMNVTREGGRRTSGTVYRDPSGKLVTIKRPTCLDRTSSTLAERLAKRRAVSSFYFYSFI